MSDRGPTPIQVSYFEGRRLSAEHQVSFQELMADHEGDQAPAWAIVRGLLETGRVEDMPAGSPVRISYRTDDPATLQAQMMAWAAARPPA